MVKRGLPTEVKMRHDSHYVEEFAKTNRSVGKIIPINRIEPNPEQPRTEIGDLSELTSSIKQKGVLEPLLVKPLRETGNWMIIAGERRWRAANLAGLRELPCIELDIDDQTVAEIALIENLQRKDLTIWEIADALAALAAKFGYTHEEIARKIGKSRTTVTESLTIAGIPLKIREICLRAGLNSKSVLLEVARQFDDEAMELFVKDLIKMGLNGEELQKNRRPSDKSDKTEKQTAKSTKASRGADHKNDKSNRNVFRFRPENQKYAVEIHFDERDQPFERKQVLKALKEAFDFVKQQSNN